MKACKDLLALAEELVENPSRMDDEATLHKSYESLITLKSSQRLACHALHAQMEGFKSQKAQYEKSQLTCRNLEYERTRLIREIELCKEYDSVELVKLCELEGFEGEGGSSKYLGRDVTELTNSAEHQAILDKLSTEIKERQSLEEKLKSLKKECMDIERETSAKVAFVKGLPNQLQAIERATMQLQKHFSVNNMYTGTQRREKYEKARILEKPLYILFCQVEAYAHYVEDKSISVNVVDVCIVEQMSDNKKNLLKNASNKKAKLVDTETSFASPSPYSVRLDISSGSENGETVAKSTFYFSFYPALDVVTVDYKKNETFFLLDNLFPGDNGRLVPGKGGFVSIPENTFCGKPYYWVQNLCGRQFVNGELYYVESEGKAVIENETAAVMKQLQIRLASHDMLKKTLNKLSKVPKTIPVHDNLRGFFDKLSNSQETLISSWAEVEVAPACLKRSQTNIASRFFTASIKKNLSYFVNVYVEVQSQYPMVAPRWKLEHIEPPSKVTFNEELHSIQVSANAEYLSFVDKNNLRSFDWILAHQLRFIICAIDELGKEGSSASPMWRDAIDQKQLKDQEMS